MENETQVLPLGADSLVGPGLETEDDSLGWGGLCWKEAQRTHSGATPNAARREGASGKPPEEVTTGIHLTDSFKIIGET